MDMRRITLGLAFLALAGCSSKVSSPTAPAASNGTPVRSGLLPDRPAVAGAPVSIDVNPGDSVFVDPDGDSLSYAISFSPAANGLAANGRFVTGSPSVAGPVTVLVEARDAGGATASDAFLLVVFAADLTVPVLPAQPFAYADASVMLPAHYLNPNAPFGNVAGADNTPAGNAVTDAGAALGRVLFYDRRLSVNDAVACASCHRQDHGFSDPATRSAGFSGGLTARHSMGLANTRYYANGRAFWDERAATLEAQALMPIQDPVEMGMSLDLLTAKLRLAGFYGPLFQAAFGTPDITSDRISRALAQFVRSMSAYHSKFDQALAGNPPDFSGFTALEQQGVQLFFSPPPGSPPGPSLRCDVCHGTSALIAPGPRNNGLDANTAADQGAGGGRFKSPSLRNVAVRAPYMHDGRFATLAAVIEHYDSGVQPHPNLDPALRNPDGTPRRLNLTQQQKGALIAFLGTLTDQELLTHPRFSDPFAP